MLLNDRNQPQRLNYGTPTYAQPARIYLQPTRNRSPVYIPPPAPPRRLNLSLHNQRQNYEDIPLPMVIDRNEQNSQRLITPIDIRNNLRVINDSNLLSDYYPP